MVPNPATTLVAFHMGSAVRRAYRRWPLEYFIELGDQLRLLVPNLTVVLTGQEFEQPLISGFMAKYSGSAIDATSIGSVEKTAALLAECALLVSNDTGVMHLGAAMGTPTVGIFGPESPSRWAPAGLRSTAICASGVTCSPCANTYRLQDPRDCTNPDRLRCLREVSVDMVLDAVKEVASIAGPESGKATHLVDNGKPRDHSEP
jgi:ADP-heptose:LPS heptosyltransferase